MSCYFFAMSYVFLSCSCVSGMTSENDNISESEYRAVLSDGDEDEDLSVTERLLKYSRNGEDAKVSNLLLSPSHEPCASFINCKGMKH